MMWRMYYWHAGGSPIMADESEEVEDITSICGGLNINIGTLNRHTIPAMFKAGKKANELGHPVLFRPGGSRSKQSSHRYGKTTVRGDSFFSDPWKYIGDQDACRRRSSTRGVDADVADAVTEENLTEAIDFVKNFAKATEVLLQLPVRSIWSVTENIVMSYAMVRHRWERSQEPDASCQD